MLPPDQVFCTPSLDCSRRSARTWVDWTTQPGPPGPATPFFSAEDKPVEPISFGLGPDRGYAHDGVLLTGIVLQGDMTWKEDFLFGKPAPCNGDTLLRQADTVIEFSQELATFFV
jgi:hypothetical protein